MSLRTGYTTGSCATAAAKAAAIGLVHNEIPDVVEIDTPIGQRLRLHVLCKQIMGDASECAVQKDAGDDPDVTNGCNVFARVERAANNTIEIDGGLGVGRITKPGLQVPVGQAAINPVPRRMIEDSVREVIGHDRGVRVVISVPDGEKLAEKTFNPKLGIVGGISIIGTTGIVRPMSDEALKASLLCGLDIAKGLGYKEVVLVPGNLGERAMSNSYSFIAKDQIVQMSNYVGFMLNAVKEKGFECVILAGHPGKLAKLLRNDFNTHSSVSRPANDVLIECVKSACHTQQMLNELKEASTVEGILELLHKNNILSLMDSVAVKIEDKVCEFMHHEVDAGVVLFNMEGSVVGKSGSAKKWLRN
ncbi:MAG: cobalt-precorrin-5B (C(1))-methyltransferase [Candidatus Kuenenia sp.]|nr:cobalt-precorrin-5B (C(1))-methyltransferase [Candidatus Kuenenia hertensis]